MGSCLSKKSACASSSSSSSSSPVSLSEPPEEPKPVPQLEKNKTEGGNVKKEIFIIRHRKRPSGEDKCEPKKSDDEKGRNVISSSDLDGNGVGEGAPVRTSSCTKEEVDAILIQCGRLSRSFSAGKAVALSSENGGRKYSGSKRSYDFDGEGGGYVLDGDAVVMEGENGRSERRRQYQGRRRTPSREREQQRSGSKERVGGSGCGGRRVSRSPGRRSESPTTTTLNSDSSSSSATNGNSRPGKMVPVPATDRSSDAAACGGDGGGEVKRIQAKRNVGESPARMRAANENQNVNASQNQQPLSLSRSNSRKAEHSPYRRNPFAEIDTNIISQKPNADNSGTAKVSDNKNNLLTTNVNCKNHQMRQETYGIPSHVALNVVPSSCPENPKIQPLTRTRSSRLSLELDIINPESLSDPNAPSSYTALLLEDIQNFHQKSTPPPAFALPPCVTKACSILEAVADLNSSTSSNLSSAPFPDQAIKAKPETSKDPILESEVLSKDDLMEPSFHKYVTVRRGTTSAGEEDSKDQESSGSNSFATGSGHHWASSSCWEPNSVESTDRWMSSSSSRSITRQAMSEWGGVVVDHESGKKVSAGKKGDSSNHQQDGTRRGWVGSRNPHMAGNGAVLT